MAGIHCVNLLDLVSAVLVPVITARLGVCGNKGHACNIVFLICGHPDNYIYTYAVSTVTIPLIITEPESQEALPGAMVTFSIVAMGDRLTYQWIKDMANIMSTDVNYSGAQSATLTVVAAREPEDEGVYDCVVVNVVGLDTSMEATLEISQLICITDQLCNYRSYK